MTSWTAVGNQIGAMVALIETFIIQNLTTTEQMIEWGWRISFMTGGLIGLFGIYLRYSLHETPVFKDLQKSHKIDKETLLKLLKKYIKRIYIGVGFGAIDAAIFYLIATYVPAIIGRVLGLSMNYTLLTSFSILAVITILLPFFGYLGDKINNKVVCSISALVIIASLYPLGTSLLRKDIYSLAVIGGLNLIPISCITALIPYQVANLFPSQVRFTGTGLSMNLADGIIGGFTPAIAILLTQISGNQSGFLWYILGCSILSLGTYIFSIKD